MKYILYFSGYRMALYRWNAGIFTGVAEFEPDEKDITALGQVLKKESRDPIRIIVDIIEEDFHVETMPSLYGRDREAVKKRLLHKYFRQYPHAQLVIQGREEQGRRDNIVLLSALTNTQLLKPWLHMLLEHKIPLEGIYTLPMIGEALLKHLGAENQRALLISQQVPSNIRQSYYDHGKLKLSRLAPGRDDYSSHYGILQEETDRTVKFLENQHYLGAEEFLEIYYICHRDERDKFRQILKDTPTRRYHVIDKDQLAESIGIKSLAPSKYSSWIFAHLLLSNRRLRPHYGTRGEKKYYYHYNANGIMRALAAGVLLISLALGAVSMINAHIYSGQVPYLESEAARYNTLYSQVISEISISNLDVADVKDSIDVVDLIRKKYGQQPMAVLQTLSAQLALHPHIRLQQLDWTATYDENHSFGEKKQETSQKAQTKPRRDRLSARRKKTTAAQVLYEKLLVNGWVANFESNPRIAIERVQQLVESLTHQTDIKKVEVLKMPFGIASDSRFSGKGARSDQWNSPRESGFTFVVIREKSP